MSQSLRFSLNQINAMDLHEFEHALHGVVENSPWVIGATWPQRPFGSLMDLAQALKLAILGAGPQLQLELLCAHPELAGQEAVAGTMTAESTSEQTRLGLNALSPANHERLKTINRAYRQRFGFPLIIALREHSSLASVFLAADQRLQHDTATELRFAIDQVGIVIRGRLDKLFQQ